MYKRQVYEQVHGALLERATFVTCGDKKLLSQLENRADATEVSASTSGETLGKLLSSNGAVKLPASYQKHDVIILSVIDYDFRFQDVYKRQVNNRSMDAWPSLEAVWWDARLPNIWPDTVVRLSLIHI